MLIFSSYHLETASFRPSIFYKR